MRVSFSSKSSAKNIKEKVLQPLTSQFFSQLIKLETEFHNKTYTADTLDELTQYYAQAVEYYDSIQDQISSYFIFKIQDMLATKKSLKLLIREQAKTSFLRETSANTSLERIQLMEGSSDATIPNEPSNTSIRKDNKSRFSLEPLMEAKSPVIQENLGFESSDEENVGDKKMAKAKKAAERKRTMDPKKSIDAMRNAKQKIFGLQLKLQHAKYIARESLESTLTLFNGSSQNNDRVVNDDISVQKQKMRQKILQRKKNSFTTYSQNISSAFLPVRADNFDSATMESMLKALDNEDGITSKENMEESLSYNSGEAGLELNQEQKSLQEEVVISS